MLVAKTMHEREYAAALLIERLVQDAYQDRRPSAIKPLQWSILRYLNQFNAKPVDVSTIARYLGKSKAPVSRAVSTLEKRGLLSKDKTVGSASIAIELTSEGRAALDDDRMFRFALWIASVSDRDRDIFLKSARALALVANEQEHKAHGNDTGC